jgi:alkanesulfonate monooxygenase SsuD/methylene tetrahydromethanopterin reductase-like flavin-dependent oxidoreductase (luciferase family)
MERREGAELLGDHHRGVRHAERLGYNRYWLAEHHNMTGIASAATAVVIGHVAAGTRTVAQGVAGRRALRDRREVED